ARVSRGRGVHADTANQIRMLTLDRLSRIRNHPGVRYRNPPIARQVIHPSITVIVNRKIKRIAVHVARKRTASAGIAAGRVVPGGSESADDKDVLNGVPAPLQLLNGELDLVQHLG